MGSAKVYSQPRGTMAETSDKKSIKNIIKSFFYKDKKKCKKEEVKKEIPETKDEHLPHPKNDIAEDFKKLEIKNEPPDFDDEFESNFERKVIKEERRVERIGSRSSGDSGFAEVKDNEVVEALEKLTVKDASDKCEKKKKLQTVLGARGPLRPKHGEHSVRPYPVMQDRTENSYEQISLNTQALSGGHVIVNTQNVDNYFELDAACDRVMEASGNSLNEQEYWKDVLELIDEETQAKIAAQLESEDLLSDFKVDRAPENYEIPIVQPEVVEPNPIEMFSNQIIYDDNQELTIFDDAVIQEFKAPVDSIFLTPPHSENVSSPMSGSPGSFYPQTSDYTLSPERSSPTYNSDYEKYQDLDLSQIDEHAESNKEVEITQVKDRTSSLSSMTLKQFKDMQKEIAVNFSKKECCQIDNKSRDIFVEHLKKLKSAERRNLCLMVSKLDLKTAYGVLHHVMLFLSKSEDQDPVQYALFGLICERVLTQKPSPFLGDFGLGVLKAAALRCPQHPALTRRIVDCIRSALTDDPSLGEGKECVFHEVDSLGDHLVTACARAGDRCATVLAAIVAPHDNQPPLFRAHHTNSDGYTALHVACCEHRADSPRLHTVHVLLEHGQADLWKGDVKGGDTALHLAVNSAHCDLRLVMVMFRHVDRKLWKKLAHCQNMSSVTPIEYARSAKKSTTRHNYPHEVYDFLKKCR